MFPWTNLAKVLLQHRLVITNIVPGHEFHEFGSSHSDYHSTEEFRALYFALEETSPGKKITVTQLDSWPEGNMGDFALITDRDGKVILSLWAAREGLARMGSEGSSVSGIGVKCTAVGGESLGGGRVLKKMCGPYSTKDMVGGSGRNLKGKQKVLGSPKSAPTISDDDDVSVSDNIASLSHRTSTGLSDDSGLAQSPHIGPSQPQLTQPQPRPKPRYSVPALNTSMLSTPMLNAQMQTVPPPPPPILASPDVGETVDWNQLGPMTWNPSGLPIPNLGSPNSLDLLVAHLRMQEFNPSSDTLPFQQYQSQHASGEGNNFWALYANLDS
jgi:hypothetical protein